MTNPKHTKYGSTNSLGNLVCKAHTNNTPKVVPLSIVFSCTKPHIETTLDYPTKSHISMDSPMHNLNPTIKENQVVET
jgi:hypothetical protein